MVEMTVAVSSCHIKGIYYLKVVFNVNKCNQERKESFIHQNHPLQVPVSKEQRQVNQPLTRNVVCHKI